MKKYKVTVRTDVSGSECEDYFEMPDNASPEEIEAEAMEVAFNMAEWGYYEVKDKNTMKQ